MGNPYLWTNIISNRCSRPQYRRLEKIVTATVLDNLLTSNNNWCREIFNYVTLISILVQFLTDISFLYLMPSNLKGRDLWKLHYVYIEDDYIC
jgi:hypothetical protein